jgi:uncharacterized membrane protein
MSAFVISQILVGLAICTDILSFQFKERGKIVACLFCSCLLIATHFMLLQHWTAAGLGLVAAARFLTCLFSTSKKVMALFLVLTIATAIFSYEGYLSLISTTGACFGTVASFCKEDKRLRQLMFIGTSLWLIHNFFAGSPVAVVMEIIFISSNMVGYFRYYILPQKQALQP